jgi:hypothetical protein
MILLPDTHIRILAPVSSLNFFDTQSVVLSHKISPLDAWNIMTARPHLLLRAAFRIRDAVSSRFGIKRIGGFSGRTFDKVSVRDQLDFFLVERSDEDCLVLTERDRHLDVMTCISSQGATVTVTSSVIVHNVFGRIYMIPVGVAHRLIVRRMLNRLQNNISV